jgi:hypothetical protein
VLGGAPAPAPIADARAACDAARDAAGALAAPDLVVAANVRWLTVIALAGRAQHGEWSAEARLLSAVPARRPADRRALAGWLALARHGVHSCAPGNTDCGIRSHVTARSAAGLDFRR